MRPWLVAQSCSSLIALFRRSMPSVRVSDRPSMSMSSRVTPYVVTTDSYAAAIALTSLQESPISVPPWSALHPPNDGTTSPPRLRSVAMSARYRPLARVCLLSPFQASVHEVLLSVSRNASVKYRAPDCRAMSEMLSGIQVSKYGAKTCVGSAVPVAAAAGPAPTRTVPDAVSVAMSAADQPRNRAGDTGPHLPPVRKPSCWLSQTVGVWNRGVKGGGTTASDLGRWSPLQGCRRPRSQRAAARREVSDLTAGPAGAGRPSAGHRHAIDGDVVEDQALHVADPVSGVDDPVERAVAHHEPVDRVGRQAVDVEDQRRPGARGVGEGERPEGRREVAGLVVVGHRHEHHGAVEGTGEAVQVDVLGEAAAQRVRLDVQGELGEADDLAAEGVHVADAAGHLAAAGDRAPVAVHHAVVHHHVLRRHVDPPPVGVAAGLDGDVVVVRAEVAVLDDDVVATLGVAAVGVGVRGARVGGHPVV